jgi:kynurenine formamidase
VPYTTRFVSAWTTFQFLREKSTFFLRQRHACWNREDPADLPGGQPTTVKYVTPIASWPLKFIDLSQDIVHKDKYGQHPLHPTPYVFPYITHEESAKQLKGVSYTTEWLNINSHSATHVDSPRHADPRPTAMTIDKVPLDWLYGDAVCIDISHFAPKAWISKPDLQAAVQKSKTPIKRGDIVLLYTGHWNRTQGTPQYATDNPGMTKEACEWLADQGVKCFGVDAVTPDNPIDQAEKRIFPTHEVLRDRQFIHLENLANLDQVVDKRFTFVAFPLKLKDCSAAPVRAVAILNE